MANNIEVFKGDSAILTVHVTDSVGADFNVTTATEITFTIKTAEDDTTVLLTKTLTLGGIILTDPTHGEFTVKIDDGDTTLIPGVKLYDIEVEIGGDVYTVVKNTITITKELTV
jgi:hypothetical protein